MFKSITLKNYRTHKLTEIKLTPITLLIGNNNSGKTNLLTGIRHFSDLVRRARPNQREFEPTVEPRHFFPHKYRLAADDEPMSIKIEWANPSNRILRQQDGKLTVPPGELTYELTLYSPDGRELGCKEKIIVRMEGCSESKELSSGYDTRSNLILLRQKIETEAHFGKIEQGLCSLFFRDFANSFDYHFQPAFLKEKLRTTEGSNSKRMKIPIELGYEGRNLQEILLYIKEHEERMFSKFTALMRRFDSSFHGIRQHHNRPDTIWEFDLKRKQPGLDEFRPAYVSDGLLKAAAIGLLASLWNPPALILLEEIENGINPGNIQELMSWLWQATVPKSEGYAPQFILTSHSPVVLREFNSRLDHVYTVHLDKSRFRSDVRNLNDTLDTLIGIGTVEGDKDEDTGVVKIEKYQLAELWYSGTIG